MTQTNIWQCGDFHFAWGMRTLVMGIVNVTPDSFSDGGAFASSTSAIEHAYALFEQGADIIDIGGESTRPGAGAVSALDEMKRVLPVIEEIAGNGKLPVSIDTVHYETATAALNAGACVINDISGLQREPRFVDLAKDSGAGLVIMHIRGTPETMQSQTDYVDVVAEVHDFLQRQVETAIGAGVLSHQICIDPGIGFSKTAEQNLILVNQLAKIRVPGIPLLLGVSRKSFLGKITGENDPKSRFCSTIAANVLGIVRGADIIRVHDVRAARESADVTNAILQETLHISI
jgi:dihydropteroate synthase